LAGHLVDPPRGGTGIFFEQQIGDGGTMMAIRRLNAWIGVLWVVAVSLICMVSTWGQGTDEGNFLQNPGFETGNYEGWGQWGINAEGTTAIQSPALAHSGRYLLRFVKDPDKDWSLISQHLNGRVTWGDKIYVRAWVKRGAGDTVEPYVAIGMKDAKTYEWKGGNNIKAGPGDDWVEIRTDYRIPSQDELPDLNSVVIELSVGMYGTGSSATFYVDDVYAGTTPPKD
jgi:hypothetical protein